jgi:hypothetical protein
MRPLRLLLASLVLLPAAFAGKITTIKGESIDDVKIVSISETEVVYTKGDVKKTVPLAGVLLVELDNPVALPKDTSYSRVELIDGTELYVSDWKVRKNQVNMTLLSGPTFTLPVSLVANVLNNAQDDKHLADWKSRTFNLRGREAFVVKKEGVISSIEATLGEGDAEGKTITAAVTIDGVVETIKRPLATLHGLVFKRVRDTKAKVEKSRLFDIKGNVVMVSEMTPKEGGLTVTTPAGAKLDFTYDQIGRIDYQKGKLDYVSELTPTKMVAKSNLDEDTKPDQWHVYKDTNLNKGPITLGGAVYARGLAVKPFCELTYDLKGDYREFSALVGLDDNVSAAGKTILVIEGDDRELGTVEISSDDKKRFKPITLNIKDVQRLKITVKADGEFDIARHLDLADAKVSK